MYGRIVLQLQGADDPGVCKTTATAEIMAWLIILLFREGLTALGTSCALVHKSVALSALIAHGGLRPPAGHCDTPPPSATVK